MIREDVYRLINGERDYQDLKWVEGRPLSDAETSVAAWIIYMERHIAQARAGIYFLNEISALEEIRKVTALGVACMEHNETPVRKEQK